MLHTTFESRLAGDAASDKRGCPFGRAVLSTAAATALAVLCALSVAEAPAEAAFPGVNGRIACQGQRGIVPNAEIFSVNPNGTDERRLTNNATSDLDPAFSPDGTKIAFAGRRDLTQPTNTDIYVANNDGNLDGPDLKRLTFNTAGERSPSWSPDGTRIVFHSERTVTFADGVSPSSADSEIYTMSATTGDTAQQPAVRLTNHRGQDAIPSWSPDGTRIAWQRLPFAPNPQVDPLRTQNLEIYTMKPDGTEQTNVSNNPGSPNEPSTAANENSNGLDRDVRWSPDSSRLAFSSTRDNVTPGNQNFEVYKMNRDGSGQTRLTSNLSGDTPNTSGDYDAPNTWSPDGRRILFTTGRSSTANADEFIAYTMDANTGEAGGLQRVAETDIFVRCDWQRLVRSVSPPPTGNYSPPANNCPGGSSGGVSCQILPGGGRRITGTDGNDTINGTAGDDVITCGDGDDVVNGGDGDDVIRCGNGNDRVNGGAGNDRLSGGAGNDRVSGSSGRDRISGGTNADRVNGGSGNDRVNGDRNSDSVSGGSGNDRAVGGSGNDRVSGNSGRDSVAGGSGNDRVAGGSGNDRISGESGNDRVSGGPGRDRLSGAGGNDSISARDRTRDTVNCGRGRDRVSADRRVDRASRNCERVRRR